jgi:hypothetical protein
MTKKRAHPDPEARCLNREQYTKQEIFKVIEGEMEKNKKEQKKAENP